MTEPPATARIAAPGPVAEMLRLAGWKRLGWLGALSALVALTEGFGFALMVPLLASMAGGVPELFGPAVATLLASVPLWGWLAIIAALITLRAIAEYWRALAGLNLSIAIVDGLRARATKALLAAEWRALSGMRQSANRALLITTIDRVGDAADAALNIIRAALTLGAIGLAAVAISPLVALAAAIAGGLVLLAYARLRRNARALGEEVRRGYDTIYALLEQALGAVRLVKGYGKEAQTGAAIGESFAGLRETQRSYVRLTGRAQILFALAGSGALGTLVWLAVAVWAVPLAILLPLVALFARTVGQLNFLQGNWQVWAHHAPALAAAQMTIAETEAQAEVLAGPAGVAIQLQDAIRLDSVSVIFGDGPAVLDEVTLSLPAKSCTALTGPSGSGKSTLADLLGGLISPDIGHITVDGIPLDGTGRHAWRRAVAYVQQDPVLFAGSVADNLRWANGDADDAALRSALTAAAADFVFDLPGGMDCPLGEGGRQLSGGEHQRIALARALLRQPQLLVLDEATSALDAASEAAVARALAKLKGSLTIVIISHRGALAAIADQTIHLERARVTG